ncbi:MAG TPA: peptide ABC transporter substrate-binding protein [Pyrinomonadaceae bacterium]|nr:peptide ABC transporter substrate-binding protein [Pyrinomonadaceae bacterium]
MNTDKHRLKKLKKCASIRVYLWTIFFVSLSSACGQLEKPKPAPFYAETAPPQIKEFRWSNGRLPKSFDPALAAAPPETDVARAVYEGLTDTHSKTLETVPAIAAGWSASDDYRTWTFKLRRDAEWSNGEPVTAADFVRSWRRLAALGDKAPHVQLLGNIVGMQAENKISPQKNQAEFDFFERRNFNRDFPSIFQPSADAVNKRQNPEVNSASKPPDAEKDATADAKPPENVQQKPERKVEPELKFGAEAVDDFTLKVSLLKPDKDFPALVAHPFFRPVYGDGKYFESGKLSADIVTNGAFRVANVAPEGITLDRSDNFWNRKQIEIERVRFVPMESAEKALEAYRAGELDAVTNIDFEPLALKLLTPFDDFRRTAHSALNFYEFNSRKPPFDDRRVREALAIALERERLTEDEMDGASLPALGFSPFNTAKTSKIKQDAERAKTLLAEAGFADGENFPVVRLVVNRNDMQQRIARSVAKMWKQNLNVETEIVVAEQAEFETARRTGDFDLLRRGVVLPTTDEAVNMLAIFAPVMESKTSDAEEKTAAETEKETAEKKIALAEEARPNDSLSDNPNTESVLPSSQPSKKSAATDAGKISEVLTENEAIVQIFAIPLYFPTSYSLVKPYIQGFEMNTLDAPSLKNVRIDNNWQPKKAKNES